MTPTFGISTHLFHDQRLTREHLEEVTRSGFDTIEIFATRSHFDYHNPAAITDLVSWMQALGLRLHAIHAPVVRRYAGGRGSGILSTASADEPLRRATVEETGRALELARHLPVSFLVVHLGVPTSEPSASGNSLEAVLRSLSEIHELAAPLGVRLALEIIPNNLSAATTLVGLLENELEIEGAGVCLDFGHAFIVGDLVDAIETSSGHLITTHLHDNGGKSDDHLVPFDGAIDWPSALMAARKVGYEGGLIFEVAATGSTRGVLEKARHARQRLESILAGAHLNFDQELTADG